MKVLGIETSCDDTGVALYDTEQGLLANNLYNQTVTHAKYNGIVPELASREHLQKLLPLIEKTLKEANCCNKDIDAIAYTQGPGLAGSLFIGTACAKTLGWAFNVPTIAVNHLQAHILTAFLQEQDLKYPFIGLLISGGHTLLVKVIDMDKYELLGESLDDAVGEAFDKVATLLGISYPGGRELSELAKQGVSGRFFFPRPMLKQNNLNFSFSGLKTAVLQKFMQIDKPSLTDKANIALAFVESVTEVINYKCKKALKLHNINKLVIAGGVSANQQIRISLEQMTKSIGAKLFKAPIELCTDNGAMIAYTGALNLSKNLHDKKLQISIKPRYNLTDLNI